MTISINIHLDKYDLLSPLAIRVRYGVVVRDFLDLALALERDQENQPMMLRVWKSSGDRPGRSSDRRSEGRVVGVQTAGWETST